jgi:hypothetical protein
MRTLETKTSDSALSMEAVALSHLNRRLQTPIHFSRRFMQGMEGMGFGSFSWRA